MSRTPEEMTKIDPSYDLVYDDDGTERLIVMPFGVPEDAVDFDLNVDPDTLAKIEEMAGVELDSHEGRMYFTELMGRAIRDALDEQGLLDETTSDR